jgi:septal ring factor EnvC (AmiA/AmiB activator)
MVMSVLAIALAALVPFVIYYMEQDGAAEQAAREEKVLIEMAKQNQVLSDVLVQSQEDAKQIRRQLVEIQRSESATRERVDAIEAKSAEEAKKPAPAAK